MNASQVRPLRTAATIMIMAALMACGTPSGGYDTEMPRYGTRPPVVLETRSAPGGYALDDAARRGYITYEITGLGGSSGNALRITIQNTRTIPIEVYVDPGTVFAASSAGVQNMVGYSVSGEIVDGSSDTMTPTMQMDLTDSAPRSFYIEAYCLDFALDNPTAEDDFEVRPVDARAATVLRVAKSEGLSTEATQAAIWMDRDHVTKREIAAKFTASEQDLEDAWQMLMTLPPPK